METLFDTMLKDFKATLPQSVELEFIDYRDNLKYHDDIIQSCIEKKNNFIFDDNYEQWYYLPKHSASMNCITDTLVQLKKYRYKDKHLKNFLYSCLDELLEIVQERNSIKPRLKLLDNTNMLGRIEFNFNNEYVTEESIRNGYWNYIYQLCTILYINPYELGKQIHDIDNTIIIPNNCPNHIKRNGKECVQITDLANALLETGEYPCVFTLIGYLPLYELYLSNFNPSIITIPQNTLSTFYSNILGSGSCTDMITIQPITINLQDINNCNDLKYTLCVDTKAGYGYSTMDTYGWGYHFDKLFNINK